MATTILGFVALPDHNWISLASGAVLLTLIMLYTLVTWLVWRRASARMVVRFGMLWVFFALGPRVLAGTMTVFTAGALLARMRVWF